MQAVGGMDDTYHGVTAPISCTLTPLILLSPNPNHRFLSPLHSPPPFPLEGPQPVPLYDEVGAGKLEVKENVAYGPVETLEMKQNPSYAPVRH